MNKRKYAQLSLSLAAMLMAVPVWAAEQNNSAADVVANQTMTIGGKEQIVSQKALEQMREAQEKEGKSFPPITKAAANPAAAGLWKLSPARALCVKAAAVWKHRTQYSRKLLKRRTAALHRCRTKPLLPMKATARLPQGKMAS